MATFTTTAKHALRRLTGANVISDIDAGFSALADDVDALLTPYSSGLLSARPVSTVGTPGKAGRRYFATDTSLEYIDLGTSWTVAVDGLWKPLDKIRAGWIPVSTLSYAAYGLAAPWVRNLDPALLAIPGKTLNYRLLVHIIVGNPAPAANFTFDVCPVTGVTNAAAPTAGTSIAQAVFNGPSANGVYYGVTAAFTATAGFYMLKATASTTPASGSEVDAHIELQYRHI